MKKVIVIGSPGAGKSTFSKSLAERSALPLHHLDMIWHRPDKTNISRCEFDAELDKILSQKHWIIDGNYNRTLQKRLEKCDTVCLLDYPAGICLAGALSRAGKKRSDFPWVEEALDSEFKEFILNFPKTHLPEIYRMLSEYKDKEIHIFKSREETEIFLNSISANLKKQP